MLLLLHLVDARDQLHVVLHEARVVLTVLLQVARQLLPVVADVGLVGVPLACLRIVSLNILLSVGLLKYPRLVKLNDTLLQLLVVSDVLDDLEHVSLEAILLQRLHVELMTAIQILVLQPLVPHLEIVHDQVQVVTDALEVLHLDLHLVDTLVQGSNIVLTGQNISLELLDLVIKHKLELFKLLRLLLKLDDACVLVLNRGSSRLELLLLGLNLVLVVLDVLLEGSRLADLFLDLLVQIVSLSVR